MSTNNKSIQILRGNKDNKLSDTLKQTVLKPGQPYFDKFNRTLQVGDGESNLNDAPYVTVKDGAINEAKIALGTITNASINANAAIQGSKLADVSVAGSKLKNATKNTTSGDDITTGEGIITAKIEDGAVTASKLGADVNNKLQNDFVTVGSTQNISGKKTFVSSKPNYKANSSATAYDLVDASQIKFEVRSNGLYITSNL